MSTSDASIGALISIVHIRGKLKQRVFKALKEYGYGGATCDDLEQALDLRHQTLSARVRELWQEGWIYRLSIQKRTRSGRWASVYRTRKRRKPRKKRERCSHCGQVIVNR